MMVRDRRRVLHAVAAILSIAPLGCGGSQLTAPTPVTLSSLAISPPSDALTVGRSYQLIATASFSDGSQKDVTSQSSWTSSSPPIALISSGGLLSVIGTGDFEIRASYLAITTAKSLSVPVDPPPIAALSCGVERWSVKTLSDPNAVQVDMNQVHATTISALNALPVHCSGLPDGRTYAPEFQTYEVTGRIVVAKSEDDRDYHVALADLDDPTATIVTELADVACSGAATSMFRTVLANARAQFESLRTGRSLAAMSGVVVRVRGVGFYDFAHGQTGRSLSCMELHPLLSVEAVK